MHLQRAGCCSWHLGALPARPTAHRISPPPEPCSSGTGSFPFPIRTSYLPLSCSEPSLYFSPPTPHGGSFPSGPRWIQGHLLPRPPRAPEGRDLLPHKALLLALCPTSEVRGVIVRVLCVHTCAVHARICVHTYVRVCKCGIRTHTCTHIHMHSARARTHASVSTRMCGYPSQSIAGSLVHIHLSDQHI